MQSKPPWEDLRINTKVSTKSISLDYLYCTYVLSHTDWVFEWKFNFIFVLVVQTDCYGVTYSKADLFIFVCTPSPMRIRGYVVWADNHKCTARLFHAAIPENSSIQRICIIFVKIQKKKKIKVSDFARKTFHTV